VSEETIDDDGSMGSVLRELVATPGEGEAVALVPGTVLGGRYQIERALGVGGMGVVYLARDQRLGRNVALKLGHVLSRDALVRTEREGVALAQLAHPNVVVVHEVGDVDGRLYIAMEYVAGGNAREWIGRAPRGWREIVELYAAAGDGLAAAHAAGFVHRDFKPDNVLVGADGRPRVADFGLVRSGGSNPPPEETVPAGPPRSTGPWAAALESSTRTGTVLGTPAYMAPEQVAGRTVDAAADQYSFCASLWEALYGARFPAQPRRAVPRRLERILRRGLATEPAARWPSMQELLAALRGMRRSRRRAVLGAGAAALVLVGGGVVLARAMSSDAAPAAAAVPACDPLAAGARDVYVDAAAHADGTGVAKCPLRTITAALALPSSGLRTIHVAAGTYDRAHGERFPLIARGDLTIAGAGEDATHVAGVGKYDHTAEGGLLDGPVRATFVVGDTRGTVTLSDLTLTGDGPTPEIAALGVVCDRGNLGALDAPLVPENTHLRRITAGPGYEQGIIVGTSAHPASGCNLELTGSTVRGDYFGMWVAGCGAGSGPPLSVRATIGDGTKPGANMFKELRSTEHDGMGIRVWDCTRALSVRGNSFIDSDGGLAMVRHADSSIDPEVVIERNNFISLLRFGVSLARGVTAKSLDHNWFYSIASKPAPASAAERGVALVLDGENERVPGFPAIAHARHNTFADNDVAIELRGGALRPGPRTIADFGTPSDPGDNSFHCNGAPAGAAVPGYDVLVTAPSDGSGALRFAGNDWDHAPPAVRRGDAPNGADIVLPAGKAPSIDVSGATVPELNCGARVAGPPR
jgi:hypothetical protein